MSLNVSSKYFDAFSKNRHVDNASKFKITVGKFKKDSDVLIITKDGWFGWVGQKGKTTNLKTSGNKVYFSPNVVTLKRKEDADKAKILID